MNNIAPQLKTDCNEIIDLGSRAVHQRKAIEDLSADFPWPDITAENSASATKESAIAHIASRIKPGLTDSERSAISASAYRVALKLRDEPMSDLLRRTMLTELGPVRSERKLLNFTEDDPHYLLGPGVPWDAMGIWNETRANPDNRYEADFLMLKLRLQSAMLSAGAGAYTTSQKATGADIATADVMLNDLDRIILARKLLERYSAILRRLSELYDQYDSGRVYPLGPVIVTSLFEVGGTSVAAGDPIARVRMLDTATVSVTLSSLTASAELLLPGTPVALGTADGAILPVTPEQQAKILARADRDRVVAVLREAFGNLISWKSIQASVKERAVDGKTLQLAFTIPMPAFSMQIPEQGLAGFNRAETALLLRDVGFRLSTDFRFSADAGIITPGMTFRVELAPLIDHWTAIYHSEQLWSEFLATQTNR